MGDFSTANIADAWMSTDEAGEDRTTTFALDAVFYAKVDLQNAPDTTMLEGVWIAVEADGQEPNVEIERTQIETGSSLLTFSMQMPNPWPPGAYALDLYLEDALDRRLDFSVE